MASEVLRRLEVEYLADSTPEAAQAWVEAILLHTSAASRLRWESVGAGVSARVQRAVRLAVQEHLREWADEDRFQEVPLGELAQIRKETWLRIPGVGRRTVDRIEEILTGFGYPVASGSREAAQLGLQGCTLTREDEILDLRDRVEFLQEQRVDSGDRVEVLRKRTEALSSLASEWELRCRALEQRLRETLREEDRCCGGCRS